MPALKRHLPTSLHWEASTHLPACPQVTALRACAESLAKLDLPSTDSNARAMLRALGKAEDASIAYGEFRRFAILMPREKLMSDVEPNLTWFESATCVPIGGATRSHLQGNNATATPKLRGLRIACMDRRLHAGTIEQGTSTAKLLIKAALAGGLSSGLSTICMHPLDTLKTRVQSIPGASIRSVVSDIPALGRRALYRGIIPAATGAFSSHGIRTCAYEAGLIGMSSFGIPFLQAQPLASFLGTVVGTVVRIPCEVLKQQLQRGNHENVRVRFQCAACTADGSPIIGRRKPHDACARPFDGSQPGPGGDAQQVQRALAEIGKLDGTAGFFRGAGALMFREVPFYVAGMVRALGTLRGRLHRVPCRTCVVRGCLRSMLRRQPRVQRVGVCTACLPRMWLHVGVRAACLPWLCGGSVRTPPAAGGRRLCMLRGRCRAGAVRAVQAMLQRGVFRHACAAAVHDRDNCNRRAGGRERVFLDHARRCCQEPPDDVGGRQQREHVSNNRGAHPARGGVGAVQGRAAASGVDCASWCDELCRLRACKARDGRCIARHGRRCQQC
jgi:Mitochondrial carrier protein